MVHWDVTLADYAMNPEMHDFENYPASLTSVGRQKVATLKNKGFFQMKAAVDYCIVEDHDLEDHERKTRSWLSLPDNEYTQDYRHD